MNAAVKAHLGCFQFAVIMNTATVNICVEFLYEHKFSFLLGKYLGVHLLNLISVYPSQKATKPFSRVARQFPVFINNGLQSLLLYILISIWYFQYFNFSHSDRCAVRIILLKLFKSGTELNGIGKYKTDYLLNCWQVETHIRTVGENSFHPLNIS